MKVFCISIILYVHTCRIENLISKSPYGGIFIGTLGFIGNRPGLARWITYLGIYWPHSRIRRKMSSSLSLPVSGHRIRHLTGKLLDAGQGRDQDILAGAGTNIEGDSSVYVCVYGE
jgi:hypothetical protein